MYAHLRPNKTQINELITLLFTFIQSLQKDYFLTLKYILTAYKLREVKILILG